jgi:hypothetical protein
MTSKKHLPEPDEALFRIQRGLAGYVSYLAACDANPAFSEYVLYEPILRILIAQGYAVRCEFKCPGVIQSKRGDSKRVDFEAAKNNSRFALEVKWAKQQRINVKKDFEKLIGFHNTHPDTFSFLCVFGRWSHIGDIKIRGGTFKERIRPIIALFERTQYGCRIYEIDTV